jgi:hypothetical protein
MTPSLLNRLVLEYIDGEKWLVTQPFTYAPSTVIVPAGFTTDFASVPRIFWRVIGPPTGFGHGAGYGKAAVIHDFLYSEPNGRTRAQCDRVFLDVMEDVGVSPMRRRLMWLAVRVGGWSPWRRHRWCEARDGSGSAANSPS